MNTVFILVLTFFTTSCVQEHAAVPKHHPESESSEVEKSSTELTTEDLVPPPRPDVEVFKATDPCLFLKATAGRIDNLLESVHYLCNENGLQILRSKPDGEVNLLSEHNSEGVSTLSAGGALKLQGSPVILQQSNSIYCNDFNHYRQIMDPDVYKDVEDIKSSNISADGCNIEFIGKKVIVFQPHYLGRSESYSNTDGTISVSFNYLSESKALIKNSTTVTIAYSDETEEATFLVLINATSTENKGFHTTVRKGLMNGTLATLRSYPSIFNNP